MPPKTAPAARRPAASRKKSGTIEIVVRRGALKRFDAFKTKTGELPVVVKWDRRLNDRRDGGGKDANDHRRYAERRRKPPFTWDLADFVVVEPTRRRKSSPGKRKKATRKS